ncbi:MAG: ribonuclease PH [bacterium]|nr:ribonuclease PH [bacterium]
MLRSFDELRTIKVEKNYLKFAESSVLYAQGNTKVLCCATLENRVPPHLKDSGTGWITAEYAMLPCAGGQRSNRSRMLTNGRTQEIKRLIGRSLRAVIDLSMLGERTITIDCDVLQADGGTRTASISAAFIVVKEIIDAMIQKGLIVHSPIKDQVAAVSVGIVKGQPTLDLCYEQDVAAEVDMNVVMTASGKFVEIQGTGEESVFDESELSKLLELAKKGIKGIIKVQNEGEENCYVRG